MADDLFDTPEQPSPDGKVPRDRWGRYLIPDPTNSLATTAWTRATTLAKTLSDPYVLGLWQQRMVAKGLALKPSLYALAAGTPLDDRDTLNQVCEDAKQAAGAKDRANLGTALHAMTEQRDRGEEPTVPEEWRADFDAYGRLVDTMGIEIVEIERIVILPEFGAAGTFDRLGIVRRPIKVQFPDGTDTLLAPGTHVIMDLKTGRDLTYGWNEIAIQLAIYANAFAMWRIGTKKFDRMPCVNKLVALVIHLPVGEGKASLHAVNIAEGWKALKLTRDVRNWRKTRHLSVGIAVTEADTLDSPAPDEHSACSAVMSGTGVQCEVIGPHVKHEGGGYSWLPDGQRCIECSRPAKNGTITHVRGCTSRPRPGRKPKSGYDPTKANEVMDRVFSQVAAGLEELATEMGLPPVQPAPEDRPAVEVLAERIASGEAPSLTSAVDESQYGCSICGRLHFPFCVPQPAETAPAPVPAPTRPLTWAEQIDACSSKPELSALYREAKGRGEWTPALQTRANDQASKFRTV